MNTWYRSVRAVVMYTALALMFLGISGCSSGGGSDSDFLSSSPSGSAGTGTTAPVVASQPTLTFKFVQGQTALTVPTNTSQIKFSFFASDNGVGAPLFEVVRPFAATITVDLEDDRARSVTVTALDENSVPVLESTVAIPANVVQEFEVDFAETEPVAVILNSIGITPSEGTLAVGVAQNLSATLNFSNGTSMPGDAVTWSVTGQGSITSDGVLTGTESGEAFVIAEYSGVEGEATFTVGDGPSLHSLAVTPSGTIFVPPTEQLDFIVEGRDQNGNFIEAGAYTIEIVTNNSGARRRNNNTTYEAGLTEQVVDTIRISAGGVSVLQDITVVDDPASTIRTMTLNGPNPLTLTASGQTATITGTATFFDGHQETIPNNTYHLTFSSLSAPRVIATSSPNVITAGLQGTARVNVTSQTKGEFLTVTVDYGANNAAPTIALDTDVLQFTDSATALTLTATVTDDQANFDGGKLTLTQDGSGGVTDAVFSLHNSAPDIGTVTNNNSSIEVALNGNATPQTIESFLGAVRIRRSVNSGPGTVNIELQDRDANDPNAKTGTASRNFESVITVGTGGDYSTVQAAVDEAEGHTSKNPIILCYAGDYDEFVFIHGAGDFESWTIYGPNKGVSAGVQSVGATSPNRVGEATVQGFQVWNGRVILDGLAIDGPDSGVAVELSYSQAISGDPSLGRIRNCRFVGRSISIPSYGVSVGNLTSAVLTDCFFADWSFALYVNQPGASPQVLRNRFQGNRRAINLSYLTTSIAIQGNSFHDAYQDTPENGYHLYVVDGTQTGQETTAVFAPGDIAGNDFTGTGSVRNRSEGTNLVVEGNWWGQTGGPLSAQISVFGTATIDADPAADTPFTNGSTAPLN